MKFLWFLSFFTLWELGCCQNKNGFFTDIAVGANTMASKIADYAAGSSLLQGLFPEYCIEPPKECPNKNITFWYYPRSRNRSPFELKITDPETFNSLRRSRHPWKIIIHGYTKSREETPNPELRKAYFERGRYNLISVDYAPLARNKCYIQAVRNAPLIANCTAQMIDALIDKGFFQSETLHVIGFSLGAQISGLIHGYMRHKKPNRVTGLDPAAPLFDGVVNERLTNNSGVFVDVIHTNALAKGKLEPSGDIDFYVNGGLSQPGCFQANDTSESSCSHNRGPLYFAESINSPEGFWGIPCNSALTFWTGLCDTDASNLVEMGEFVPFNATGIYYLQTNSQSPFAMGKVTRVLRK